MVVNQGSPRMEGRSRQPVRGGLVSQRVEMYENKPRQWSNQVKIQSSPSKPESRDSSPPVEEREDSNTRSVEKIEEIDNPIDVNLIHSGVKLYEKGDYIASCEAFESALERHQTGKDSQSQATILSNIGPVYLKLGKLEEAERALVAAVDMKRRLQPDASVSDTLSNLGTCANMRGDYDASLNYYRDALQDLRLNSGSRRDMANVLFNLGRLLVQKAEWDTALGVLRESVRVQREVFGENHSYVAQTLELVGFAQLSTEAYDSALISFTGALAVYRRTKGPVDGSIANTLFNVGLVREKKRELADAWEAYTTCRELHRKLQTPRDDPSFKAVRASIDKVERMILKQNQSRVDKVKAQQKLVTIPDKQSDKKKQVMV